MIVTISNKDIETVAVIDGKTVPAMVAENELLTGSVAPPDPEPGGSDTPISTNNVSNTLATNPNLPFEIKLWICSDHSESATSHWYDFSDRCMVNGRNSLADIGNVQIAGEVSDNVFNCADISVIVTNEDNFWNDDPVNYPAYGLRDVDGVLMTQQVVYDLKDWKNRLCKVFKRYSYQGPNGMMTEDVNLSYYYLDGIEFDHQGGKAQLRLRGLQSALLEAEAKTIRNGKQLYRNRPIIEMIRKLLLKNHSQAEIDAFDLKINTPIPNYVTNSPLSSSSRVPFVDQNNKFIDADYNNQVCRYLLVVGNYIYMAVNEELYKFDIANMNFELLSSGEAAELGEGYNIHKMFYEESTGKIWCMAWNVPSATNVNYSVVNSHLLFAYYTPAEGLVQLSPIDADSAHTHFFSGEYCYRNGIGQTVEDDGFRTYWSIGQLRYDGVTFNHGENVTIPFKQRLIFNRRTGAGSFAMKPTTGIFTIQNMSSADLIYDSPTEWPVGLTPIMNKKVGASGDMNVDLRWSCGQSGFCEYDAATGTILFCSINQDEDPTNWYLYKYTIATNTVELVVELKSTSGGAGPQQPMCGCTVQGTVYIGSIYWHDVTAGTNASFMNIKQIDISTGTETIIYDAYDDWYAGGAYTGISSYTPLEMIVDNDELSVVLLRRDLCLNSDSVRYVIAKHPFEIQNSFDVKSPLTQYQPKSLCVDADHNIYSVECGTGKMNKWTGVNGAAQTNVDEYQNFGDTEFNCASNMVAYTYPDGSQGFFCISAPDYPDEFLMTEAQGAYALVKYANWLFPFLPLYDFENPSPIDCWTAICKLGQAAYHLAGYDQDGTFYFKPRPVDDTTYGTPTIVRTFTNDYSQGGNRAIDWVQPNRGDQEISNYCAVTPYGTVVEPVEGKVQLGPNSFWDEYIINEGAEDEETITTNSDFQAWSSTFDSISVMLRATDNANHFEFKAYSRSIVAHLDGDFLAGATVLTTDLDPSTMENEITANIDTIVVPSSDDENLAIDQVILITAYDPLTRTITLAEGLPGDMASGAEIVINDGYSGKWLPLTNNAGASIALYTTPVRIQSYTGTTLLFDTKLSAKQIVDVDPVPFTKGDIITVTSKGLQAKQSPESITIAYNSASRKIYNLQQYQGNLDNRFLNRRMANNLANYIVRNFKLPKWSGTMRCVADYSLKVGDVIAIIDKKAFKAEKDGYIRAYIRSISYEPKTNYMLLQFRGIDFRSSTSKIE